MSRYSPFLSLQKIFCTGYIYRAFLDRLGYETVLKFNSQSNSVLIGLQTTVSSCSDAFLLNFYVRIVPPEDVFLPAKILRAANVLRAPFIGSDGPPASVPPNHVSIQSNIASVHHYLAPTSLIFIHPHPARLRLHYSNVARATVCTVVQHRPIEHDDHNLQPAHLRI